ncbi:TPA: chromate efflux transporter [Pseudomonas aeruginosa]|uniref:Chromate transport protein n=4 Tax=Pseudomonas TaxID=286 RepID=A0A9P1VXU0_PSEAI|nr:MULTISPECIES: chromate efflux transporter [Pseudomonadaceae]MCF6753095.1 chromate efflux transporter [Stutzerimonas stutzeri]NLC02592.1 chromate efflux transporter [Halopseudomonas formosensis]CDI94681.1 chromate transporter [Pseudomonas aeruginosa PA38182]AKE67838.1 chromate transporter [Pseudomonas aeruginosa]ARG53156.1 chromate transporter [Pseudomonas aeruginosa]|tara:strand:+ start:1649 stop:2854 length:1206 start_codon:yes stop_codon:yes gene_type:complete
MTDPLKTDRRPWAVFLIFLRLGLTSFGGPIAHLGYFRDEFVVRRQWLSERSYADLVALCQFLPGPASSQVGIALGLSRSGYRGALAAWLGFTLPSAIALIFFALGIASYGDAMPAGVLHGLKVVAVAVVAQAVWGMARNLCPDAPRISIMAAATCFVLLVPSAWGQVSVIILAAIVGLLLFKPQQGEAHDPLPISVRRRVGLFWLALFFALLLGLPLLTAVFPNQTLAMVDAFYRSGSLVFGGGHVVLPLLQAEVVPTDWVDNDAFLAGYGAAQAVPGPLFTFAAFLGASMNQAPTGWLGGLICLLAIFAPSFLLVVGALPFWEHLRRNLRTQAALLGINAAVVGLLLAALYQPVWTSAIHGPKDFGLALVALVALMFWKLPPWLVVLGSGILGGLLSIAL